MITKKFYQNSNSFMTTNFLIRGLALAHLCLLTMGCNSEAPQTNRQANPEEQEIRLNIQTPNGAVLRSGTLQQTDPMSKVSSLRLVFYQSSPQGEKVAITKELQITETQLNDVRVKIPQGEYKLVAIANPTNYLKQKTQRHSPLSNLTKGTLQSASDFKTLSETNLLIAMLNDQGPISISRQSFDNSSPSIPIVLEPALARVLVYGEPTIAQGTKGNKAARYVVNNVSQEMACLRMMNTLQNGQAERAGDGSSRSNRYASCTMWDGWAAALPNTTKGVATFDEALYAQEQYWTPVKNDIASLGELLQTSSMYSKEGVVPPNAYLKGLVPTVVVAFPYIPFGLNLKEEEGWVEYLGQVYSESQIKEMLVTDKYASEALKKAINEAGISASSFSKGFALGQIRFFHQAMNYYSIPIRHFAAATEPNAYGRYGIVRGNEYRIKLIKVSQMGSPTPIVFKNNLEPIEENQAISHTIRIAPMEIREQENEL